MKSKAEKLSIGEHLEAAGASRRDFLRLCSVLMVTAPAGLALTQQNSVTTLASKILETR
jgi:hypothetical protein